jgi:hypothetical protein
LLRCRTPAPLTRRSKPGFEGASWTRPRRCRISAFEVDPESALHAAGLDDITAADVQQVIPLVVDSAPATGLHDLAGIDDLTTGVANLDLAGAVSQLQAITSQVAVVPSQVAGDLSLTGTLGSVNATVLSVTGDHAIGASVLSGNSFGLGGLDGVTSAVPAGVGGLTAGDDPGLHLDSGVVAPVEHTVTGVTGGVDHLTTGAGAGPVDLDVAGVGGATSSVGSLIEPDLGHVLPHDPVGDLGSTVSSVGGAGHEVTSGVLGNVLHPADETEPSHDLLGGLHL